jgi:hypothetical protein
VQKACVGASLAGSDEAARRVGERVMKTRMTTWISLVLVALALGLAGCSKTPTVEDICRKIAQPAEVAECTAELGRELAQCENREDVLKCMDGAANDRAAEACFSQCRVAGGGE